MRRKIAVVDVKFGALVELLRTAETLWNASRVFFARWNLSPSQFNVLNLLYLHPEGCTQVELSRQLIMHRSNVTGLVDRLETRGLVKRFSSQSDRRAINVRLTAYGRKLVRTVKPHYRKAAGIIWAKQSDSIVASWMKQLETINANAAQIAGLPIRSGKNDRLPIPPNQKKKHDNISQISIADAVSFSRI